jgi:hypothetical protein
MSNESVVGAGLVPAQCAERRGLILASLMAGKAACAPVRRTQYSSLGTQY